MSESGYSTDEDSFYCDEMIRFKRCYRIQGLMRKAAHGDIYLAHRRNKEKTEVVLKVIKKRKSSLVPFEGRRVPAEVKYHAMCAAVDEGTVALYDVIERVADFILVMEKPSNSIDILELVNQYGPMSSETVRNTIKQVALSSLRHHEHAGVFHGDIKVRTIPV